VDAAVDDQAGPAGTTLMPMSTQEPAPAWFLSINEQDHRKGAKCFIVFVREFLCDLCVSAVKPMFMDGHCLKFISFRGAVC
jgi:hypothetical protein